LKILYDNILQSNPSQLHIFLCLICASIVYGLVLGSQSPQLSKKKKKIQVQQQAKHQVYKNKQFKTGFTMAYGRQKRANQVPFVRKRKRYFRKKKLSTLAAGDTGASSVPATQRSHIGVSTGV
jgi:hypothetical protein